MMRRVKSHAVQLAVQANRAGIGARVIGVVNEVARNRVAGAGADDSRAGRIADYATAHDVVVPIDDDPSPGSEPAIACITICETLKMAQECRVAILQHVVMALQPNSARPQPEAPNRNI